MIKKIVFFSFLLAFNYIVVEAISYGFYAFKYKDYALSDIQASKQEAIDAVDQNNVYTAGEDLGEDVILKKIVHPYIGYTIDGKTKKEGCVSEELEDCYTRIRVATDRPFPKRGDDKLIVAIFGGSFAYGTTKTGNTDYYHLLFSKLPQYQDKEIIILSFADGGYKQPQQVLYLNYLYSLGAEFDIVINIDGFNEMAVAHYGYRLDNIHPSFPQSWSGFMQSALSSELLDAYAEKKSLIESHANYARFSLLAGIRWSPTMNLIWRIKNDNYRNDVLELTTAIQSSGKDQNKDFRYQEVGPDYVFTDWDAFAQDSAKIWARSSISMKGATEINGGQYFHFLQPNQNIEGAKILSEEELRVAYSPNEGYGGVYRQSYQHLVEEFDLLEANGVTFFDLTYHFKDTPDTLYIDTCCHMNYKGYGLVVTEIIEQIAPLLTQP